MRIYIEYGDLHFFVYNSSAQRAIGGFFVSSHSMGDLGRVGRGQRNQTMLLWEPLGGWGSWTRRSIGHVIYVQIIPFVADRHREYAVRNAWLNAAIGVSSSEGRRRASSIWASLWPRKNPPYIYICTMQINDE